MKTKNEKPSEAAVERWRKYTRLVLETAVAHVYRNAKFVLLDNIWHVVPPWALVPTTCPSAFYWDTPKGCFTCGFATKAARAALVQIYFIKWAKAHEVNTGAFYVVRLDNVWHIVAKNADNGVFHPDFSGKNQWNLGFFSIRAAAELAHFVDNPDLAKAEFGFVIK